MIAGWIPAVLLGIGAQVRGAEECSAAIEPAWGCGAARFFGPISLIVSITLLALWRRSTPASGRRGIHLLWGLAVITALVPVIWIRAAGVTA